MLVAELQAQAQMQCLPNMPDLVVKGAETLHSTADPERAVSNMFSTANFLDKPVAPLKNV